MQPLFSSKLRGLKNSDRLRTSRVNLCIYPAPFPVEGDNDSDSSSGNSSGTPPPPRKRKMAPGEGTSKKRRFYTSPESSSSNSEVSSHNSVNGKNLRERRGVEQLETLFIPTRGISVMNVSRCCKKSRARGGSHPPSRSSKRRKLMHVASLELCQPYGAEGKLLSGSFDNSAWEKVSAAPYCNLLNAFRKGTSVIGGNASPRGNPSLEFFQKLAPFWEVALYLLLFNYLISTGFIKFYPTTLFSNPSSFSNINSQLQLVLFHLHALCSHFSFKNLPHLSPKMTHKESQLEDLVFENDDPGY